MLDTVRQDLTFAARTLRRGRLVTGVAIASLAIGIAANTTVFSLVQALEFPNLIYPDAWRIVCLESRNDARGIAETTISEPDGRDVATASRTLRGASLAAAQSSLLRVGATPRRVRGRRVDPEFFRLLRVAPALGRTLGAGDAQGVIVLSDALWRSAFGGDRGVIGKSVRLDGGAVTVAGVMPPLFDGDADFWTPLAGTVSGARRDDRQFDLFARVAPGITLDAVQRELASLSGRLAAEHPVTNTRWTIDAVPLWRLRGRDERHTFLLLQAAVGFVLLIACANIANLLLTRGAERAREMAVRIALGAGRHRLVATLLTEAILLSSAGGALGVLLSMWSIRVARATGGFPDVMEPHLNLMVLAFTAAVSVATGVLCGIAPALRASAVAPEPVLRAAGRVTRDRTAERLSGVLVVAQIAGALVLATCAVLLLRSFANRERVVLGFDPRGAFRADLSLPFDRYADPDRARRAIDGILAAAAQNPDVAAVGARTWALPTGAGAQRQFTLPDRDGIMLPAGVRRGVEAVTPGYFAAVGATFLAGRSFTAADRAGAVRVAIVNHELARRLWASGEAVGRPLRLGAPGEPAPIVTVVGVVSSMRRSPMHDDAVATAYVPFAQYPNPTVTLVARARGEGDAAVRAVDAAVHAADPELLIENVKTLEADMATFLAPLRFLTTVLSGFAVSAMLLAALGIFGMMSYSVVQRYREIAVRSALGASHTAIVSLVFAAALRLTAIGVAAGALLSVWAARALRSFLFGVTATDPLTYALVAIGIPVVALAACWRPARKAASIDPMSLLRS